MEKGIWQKYRGQGLVVLGVNAGEREDPKKLARQFVEQHGVTYPTVMDTEGEVSEAYQVSSFPTVALIDRKGVLQYLEPGFDDLAVVTRLESLLGK
jgi:peroxiredoxin